MATYQWSEEQCRYPSRKPSAIPAFSTIWIMSNITASVKVSPSRTRSPGRGGSSQQLPSRASGLKALSAAAHFALFSSPLALSPPPLQQSFLPLRSGITASATRFLSMDGGCARAQSAPASALAPEARGRSFASSQLAAGRLRSLSRSSCLGTAAPHY